MASRLWAMGKGTATIRVLFGVGTLVRWLQPGTQAFEE